MLNDFDNYNSLIRRNVHSVIILPTRGEYKGDYTRIEFQIELIKIERL